MNFQKEKLEEMSRVHAILEKSINIVMELYNKIKIIDETKIIVKVI